MKQIEQGFTLIELMIVVAIIGILASIALPAYQDYTKRTHFSEGLALGSAAKNGIVEYYEANGQFPADNTQAGLSLSDQIIGNAVTSVEVQADGRVEIIYNAKVEDGETLILSPYTTSGSLKFTCTQGTVNDKYRPASCR